MKKILIVFIVISFLWVGCQANDDFSDDLHNEPNEMISIRSIGELA